MAATTERRPWASGRAGLRAPRTVRFVPGRWGDAAWTALMAVYALHVGITGDEGFLHGNTARSALCLTAALGFLLLCRRSAFAYCALAALVFAATDFYVPLTAAAFALGVVDRDRTGRRPGGRGAAIVVGVLLSVQAGLLGGYRRAAVECPAVSVDPLLLPCGFLESAYRSAAAVIAAYALGAYLRRSAQMRSLNRRLAREHDLRTEQARISERTSIAGEMHDLLGHHLALTGIYAGALALKTSVSPEVNRMARVVVDSNTTAARTLHRVVEILRREPTEDTTSARDMTALAARVRETGSEVTGPESWDGFDALPAVTRRALSRMLREAVTNIVKHAPGSRVGISFVLDEDTVELTVTNGPTAPGRATAALAGGFGLAGLEERMGLLGGLLTAGPRPGGAFRVRAVLPLPDPCPALSAHTVPRGPEAP
ncbi:histidine kinase [Streptomyces sp. NBC_00536]|uniref:sensor histidine kinase n=1 Tax=Streptomyces sp. NBC_00536 TaxID=2975769 RepID=UPI002E81B9FA|nr:ATP-binding protein [Streptomyces sp. NBC_00536]WUC77080.1 histidine kinase [Streptomyces sp. NBC_00536]